MVFFETGEDFLIGSGLRSVHVIGFDVKGARSFSAGDVEETVLEAAKDETDSDKKPEENRDSQDNDETAGFVLGDVGPAEVNGVGEFE